VSLFLVTILATYGSNVCHYANIENILLAVGWRGVKRSIDKKGSSVHASSSFACLSVANSPTTDEAMNIFPIG
jgi:hypothetical protein